MAELGNDKPLHVLLVGASSGDAAQLQERLRAAGWPHLEVDPVSTNEALASLDGVDAALVDLNEEPDKTLDAIAQMRSASATLPIVVHVPRDDVEGAARALEAGAHDYVCEGDGADRFPRALRLALARGEVSRATLHLTQHDRLTGLVNRALFYDRVTHAMARSARENVHLGVLLLDIDRFKDLNDEHGAEIGDLVLRSLAQRMRQVLRKVDTIARMGGDVFAMVLEGAAAPADLGTAAGKLLHALRQPFVLEGKEVTVSASIGISIYPLDGANVDALLDSAHDALRRAKEGGGATFQLFHEDER